MIAKDQCSIKTKCHFVNTVADKLNINPTVQTSKVWTILSLITGGQSKTDIIDIWIINSQFMTIYLIAKIINQLMG